MAFVRMLSKLLRDKGIGKHVVPIVPDEARTFGMESLFRQVRHLLPRGQLYEPVDSESLLYYKEARTARSWRKGINEAGLDGSFIAAGTAYANHGREHDPVLHLLLHVRLPARGRPGLGRGRHALPRLPAGRHGRAAPR
jgi:pyruvate dehydrogenase E1 component